MTCFRAALLTTLVLASSGLLSQVASADWNNDYAKAQDCFNKNRNRDTVLRCLSPIRQYSDGHASRLKCAIRAAYQGFDFFQFPWVLHDPNDYLWIYLLNAFSDRQLSRQDAVLIRTDCGRAPEAVIQLFGRFYWLRALLLEVSPMEASALRMNLPAAESGQMDAELGQALDEIVLGCKRARVRKELSLCEEARQLASYSGASTYEKFANGLRRRRSGTVDTRLQIFYARAPDACEALRESNEVLATRARSLEKCLTQ